MRGLFALDAVRYARARNSKLRAKYFRLYMGFWLAYLFFSMNRRLWSFEYYVKIIEFCRECDGSNRICFLKVVQVLHDAVPF